MFLYIRHKPYRISIYLCFSHWVMSELYNLMDCSTRGLPVLHQQLGLAQTHVHWIGDAIQPSCPLLSPSPAFSLSQHQNLYQWVSSSHQFSWVQSFSHVRLFALPWTKACQASLSITNTSSLLKLMSIGLVMSSNHLILCHRLLLPPSIFSSIRVFSNESVLHNRQPKHWSFSFNISPSNEHSGLISFRMDWLDLLAVQGTLKSLLQHHSSKASILYDPTFISIHDYWKNHSCD